MSSRIVIASRTNGPFVQHHALGPLGHRHVRHLGTGVAALAHERVEYVRRPDHGYVRGLAQPEDLLLHLREAAEADLDAEVAAGDHHGERLRAGALDDDLGQPAHREVGLDLGRDRGRPRRAARELLLQARDVAGALHERVADDVGLACDRVEVGEVLRGQRVDREGRAGEVEALVRAQPALRLDGDDAQKRRAAVGLLGLEPDPALVDVHLGAGPQLRDDLGQGALELGRIGRRARRARDEPHRVADADPYVVAGAGDPAGARAGPLEVDEHAAGAAHVDRCAADARREGGPGLGVVVGAVDARDVGAAQHELAEEGVVAPGLARQGDHDPHFAAVRGPAEHRVRLPSQEPVAAVERRGPRRRRGGAVDDRRERRDHRVEVLEHARLAAAERGEPERHQRDLQRAEVAASQRDVVGEVDRARHERAPLQRRPPAREQLVGLDRDLGAEPDKRVEQLRRLLRPRLDRRDVRLHDGMLRRRGEGGIGSRP
jgi:hypothetical protein